MILSSALKGEGLDEIEEVLQGRTTVVAGPSGVGKSSLTNSLQEEVEMETGEISRKLKRGNIPRAMHRSYRWHRIHSLWIRRDFPPYILKIWRSRN